MATTVLEALQNASINIENGLRLVLGGSNPMLRIAQTQLHNAIEALENGKQPNDVLQDSIGGEVKTGKEDS